MRKLAPREWKWQQEIARAKRPEMPLPRGGNPAKSLALDRRSEKSKKRVKISLPAVKLPE